MKKQILTLLTLALISGLANAGYIMKVPLETSAGGILPNGSINLSSTNGSGGNGGETEPTEPETPVEPEEPEVQPLFTYTLAADYIDGACVIGKNQDTAATPYFWQTLNYQTCGSMAGGINDFWIEIPNNANSSKVTRVEVNGNSCSVVTYGATAPNIGYNCPAGGNMVQASDYGKTLTFKFYE
jgi:hypothetical protein